MKLKRIGVMSCGLVSGVIYAAVGLIIGAIMSLVGLMGAALGGGQEGSMMGILFGVGAIIFAPIFYGLMGFLGGLLMAWIYNVVAGFTGGIEVEFDNGSPSTNPPSVQHNI